MLEKKYGRILSEVTDKEGRKIALHLNIYKHIINYHNKIEMWNKYWKEIVQGVMPDKRSNSLFYDRIIEGYLFRIIAVKEREGFIIKTAIISKGSINGFRRLN